MPQKPFVPLPAPRPVVRPDLPPDLVEFYTRHEGVEQGPDGTLWFYPLAEITRTDWAGLTRSAPAPDGWESFEAIRIAWGEYFTDILYVLYAPSCPRGSILAFGSTMPGPSGTVPHAVIEPSLVLAPTFTDWLAHLERWDGYEPVLGLEYEMTELERAEIDRYYLTLNPNMNRR